MELDDAVIKLGAAGDPECFVEPSPDHAQPLPWLPPVAPVDPTLAAFERFLALAEEQDAAVSVYQEHVLQHWTPNPGPQSDFFWSNEREVLYGGAAGGGKALSVDTAIPTPTGWTTMGALVAGDEVFDEQGQPCRVLWCSDVRSDRPCYEVEFSDGTVIVADAGHLWVTSTVADRAAILRTNPAWREARKGKRAKEHAARAAKRAATPGKKGGQGKSLRPDLAAANAARVYIHKPLPVPTAKTTEELAATLMIGKHVNHAVDVSGALKLPERELPIDPYVLGLWLGDGTSASAGMTTADPEIVDSLRAAGYEVEKKSAVYAWGVRGGLYRALRLAGLLKNKHVPAAYLRASEAQRLALLQGLMDTDGGACENGSVEFTTTSAALRDGAYELILSLGIKVTIQEGRATIAGMDCGPKYRFKFLTDKPMFRLLRKLDLQKRGDFRGTHALRYVVAVRPIPSEPVKCIGVDSLSHCYLAGREMVPTHNSSSEIALPLRWCNHRAFRCLILRRETTQLQDLLDKAAELYAREFPGVRYRGDDDTYTFPSGAVVRFAHCKDANDWEKYAGHEYHLIEFDELTHFLLKQYREITKRIRSAVPELPRFTRAGTNPGGIGHAWTFARWAPWLDPTCVLEDWESVVVNAKTKVVTRIKGKGLPPRVDEHGMAIPTATSGQPLWVAQTKNGEKFSSVPVTVLDSGKEFPTLTRSFIPARLTDNPKLTEADPMYEQSLLDNDPVRVAQLLDGNWLVKPAAGLLFKRDWFELVDESPMDGVCARVWDLAGTEPTTDNPDPDWTTGLLGSLSKDGFFYLEHMERFREGPGGVRARVKAVAQADGTEVPIRLPQDPGQAGKDQGASYVQMLQGYDVRVKTVTGSKMVRASVASAQASPKATGSTCGRICVVRGAWNEAFFEELEAFPTGAHDDQVDVLSDLIAELTLGGGGTVGVMVVG